MVLVLLTLDHNLYVDVQIMFVGLHAIYRGNRCLCFHCDRRWAIKIIINTPIDCIYRQVTIGLKLTLNLLCCFRREPAA